MANNTSAGVLVIEQLWAKRLKMALLDKGAVLLDEGRIHPDTIVSVCGVRRRNRRRGVL